MEHVVPGGTRECIFDATIGHIKTRMLKRHNLALPSNGRGAKSSAVKNAARCF